MWKVFVCLIVLGFLCDDVKGQGTVILSGTLKVTGGTNCLQVDGNSVAAVTDNTCVEVVVVDAAKAGEYIIQKLEGTRADNVLKLENTANSFGPAADGSMIVFFDVDNNANLDTVADLTDSTASFVIRDSADTTDCLSTAGTYTTGGACDTNADLWYFELVSCKVDDCATCSADVLVCTTCITDATGDGTDTCTCPANKVTNEEDTACEDCNAVLHAQCTACNQDSGNAVCTACNANYITDATLGCADCSVALHAECTACKQNSGTALCTACNAGYITDATDGCTECQDNEIIKDNACTECEPGTTPHSNRIECVDACLVDNCRYCDNEASTCTQCDSGYEIKDKTCTAEENAASGMKPFVSVLTLAILTGRVMA